MYVMTNQNGPCFVHVNRRAEVQTQMFFGEVIACYRVLVREMLMIPLPEVKEVKNH
jgi:hypothetical protein